MDSIADMLLGMADATAAKLDSTDYIGENGLLFCGKCRTPKQVEVDICGTLKRPYCMCKCESEAYKAEQEKFKKAQQREEIARMIETEKLVLDIDMTKYGFDKDDRRNPVESDRAKKYVDNFQRMKELNAGLMFLGNSGTGKTFLAGCIAIELINQGYKCLMTDFPRIINEITGTRDGKQAYIDSFRRYDLLVIDDMAIERDTEYASEIVHNVIDSRYRSGMPLIITTNLTLEEFAHPKDVRKARIYSRLKEMCVPVPIVGRDRRNEKAALRNQEVRELLGI